MNWARRTPLRYPGGKGKLAKYMSKIILKNKLINATYIELYAGGAGIAIALLINGYVSNIVINDADKSIYAFWYSILNNTIEFCEKIRNTEVTIEEWKLQKDIQNKKNEVSLFELGFSTFFLNRTNRSGIIKAGMIGGWNQTGADKIDCRFNKQNLIKRITDIADRKDSIKIYNLMAEDFITNLISNYNNENTFIFCDPPYFENGSSLYANYYNDNDHVNLKKLISKNLKTPWILTYDNNEYIQKLYSEFIQTTYSLSYSAAEKRKGSEIMIYSPLLKELVVPVNL